MGLCTGGHVRSNLRLEGKEANCGRALLFSLIVTSVEEIQWEIGSYWMQKMELWLRNEKNHIPSTRSAISCFSRRVVLNKSPELSGLIFLIF